jgi:hypothetical protein
MRQGSVQAALPTSGLHNSFGGPCKGLQEVFADEIADEARGLEKMNRHANEMPLDSGTSAIQ